MHTYRMDADDLTALDVALLMGNSAISALLVNHGARAHLTRKTIWIILIDLHSAQNCLYYCNRCNSYLQEIAVAKLMYDSCAWFRFANKTDQQRVDAYLRRSIRNVDSVCPPELPSFQEQGDTMALQLFDQIQTIIIICYSTFSHQCHHLRHHHRTTTFPDKTTQPAASSTNWTSHWLFFYMNAFQTHLLTFSILISSFIFLLLLWNCVLSVSYYTNIGLDWNLQKTNFVTDQSNGDDEFSTKLEILYEEALNCANNLKLLASSPLLALHNSAQRKV